MKLVVLVSRVPYPIEKGDKLRAFYQIKYLSENNEIHLIALSDRKPETKAADALKPYCVSLHIFRLPKIAIFFNLIRALFCTIPFQAGYFFNSHVKRKIQHLIRNINPDHIYCQLIRTTEYVKLLPYPKTLDYQDVFSKGVERRMTVAPWWMQPVFRCEYKRLLRYEKEVFDHFDHTTIISQPDRDLIPHEKKDDILIIPNGVDYTYFEPQKTEKEFQILFTGNMGYPPNADAAQFLALEILPIVHQEKPEATLVLAGINPGEKIKAMQNQYITVTGWVPDMRYYYARSQIFIAPMRLGTGLQNKLLEAMAMLLPCITSLLANQALKALPWKEILVADSASGFANHILKLLNDSHFADTIANNGMQYVKKQYNWAESVKKLEDCMRSEK